MTNKHIPVLLQDVLAAFSEIEKISNNPFFLDGTLGGGGHTEELLAAHATLKIVGCDYDQTAIDKVSTHLSKEVTSGRLEFFHGNFSEALNGEREFEGMLLDLGYSSNQLEDPEYGMSFQAKSNGPLDMRLSRPPVGLSAWDILRESTDDELADILYVYGEIHDSRRIARNIHEAIGSGEITNSTSSLAGFLSRIDRTKKQSIHPATLVFQALRIAVNDELRNLDEFLKKAILRLRPSGILAIISFHSLEDRLVKRWGQNQSEKIEALTRKPIEASEEESHENPRSRSAKLRVYRKR